VSAQVEAGKQRRQWWLKTSKSIHAEFKNIVSSTLLLMSKPEIRLA
jgi:hypothetical protein